MPAPPPIEEQRATLLKHCLWMAQRDPEYAIWAAGWYEANQPEVMKNLQAKVRQEIARASRRPSPAASDCSPG